MSGDENGEPKTGDVLPPEPGDGICLRRCADPDHEIWNVTCPCGTVMLCTDVNMDEKYLEFMCALCESTMRIPFSAIKFKPGREPPSNEVDGQHRIFLTCVRLLESSFPPGEGSWMVGVMYADKNAYKVRYGGGVIEVGGLAMQAVIEASREHHNGTRIGALVQSLGLDKDKDGN